MGNTKTNLNDKGAMVTMKKLIQFLAIFVVLAVALPGVVWATAADDADTVTVSVPTVLSISDGTGNFPLTFQSTSTNGVTNFQTVGYAVSSNNLPNSALTGALSAKISTLLDGINIRALGTRTYTNNGTASNAVLTESPAGPITIGTSATGIMDKPAAAGSSGKILNGTAFVAWQAQATRDLTFSDGGAVTLTVTLKDA